jgi:sulfate transport system ATP-binding protein
MNQGKIEQIGSPEEVYDHPATPFVFNFLGDVNLFHGRTGDGTFGMTKDDVGYVRPHDLEICKDGSDGAIQARISRTHAVGPVVRLELQRNDTGERFEAHMPREEFRALAIIAGDEIFARPRKLKVFPATNGSRAA